MKNYGDNRTGDYKTVRFELENEESEYDSYVVEVYVWFILEPDYKIVEDIAVYSIVKNGTDISFRSERDLPKEILTEITRTLEYELGI